MSWLPSPGPPCLGSQMHSSAFGDPRRGEYSRETKPILAAPGPGGRRPRRVAQTNPISSRGANAQNEPNLPDEGRVALPRPSALPPRPWAVATVRNEPNFAPRTLPRPWPGVQSCETKPISGAAGRLRKTKPIGGGSGGDQRPCGTKEKEVGRGRPTYEEPRGSRAKQSQSSQGRGLGAEGGGVLHKQTQFPPDGQTCKTNPIYPTRDGWPSLAPRRSGLAPGPAGGLFLKSHWESGKSRGSEVCGLCFGSMRTLSAGATGRGVVMSGIRPHRQAHPARSLPFPIYIYGRCNRGRH
jgi:hypothetical protein